MKVLGQEWFASLWPGMWLSQTFTLPKEAGRKQKHSKCCQEKTRRWSVMWTFIPQEGNVPLEEPPVSCFISLVHAVSPWWEDFPLAGAAVSPENEDKRGFEIWAKFVLNSMKWKIKIDLLLCATRSDLHIPSYTDVGSGFITLSIFLFALLPLHTFRHCIPNLTSSYMTTTSRKPLEILLVTKWYQGVVFLLKIVKSEWNNCI